MPPMQPVPMAYGQPATLPGPVPMGAQRPQYLASQSMARDMAPTEPWAGSLRGMMIFFGIVLVATVALPVALSPMRFMWEVLTSSVPIQQKLWPLVLAAGGLLALLFGLLPVPTAARGIVAAIVGILPFVVMIIVGAPGGGGMSMPMAGWQGYLV